MRRSLAALLVVILLAALRVEGQDTPQFSPFGLVTVLDTYLESLRQQAGIPGMSAAVVREGTVVWEKGYGYQNVERRIPATPITPYLVGDVSGTLAAAMLLKCVEERRLELDRPLREYDGIVLPEPDVTLRQLLSHTPSDPAGEPFVYSPSRYAQLTGVMEWCTRGQSYRKSVAHRILKRFAMSDSVPGLDLQDPALPLPEGLFDPADLQEYRRVLSNMAVAYRVDGRNRTHPTELTPFGINAADGLVSTVRDLAKLDGALDARFPLLDETLQVAWNPVIGRNGKPTPMGLGWFVQSYRGQRIVWHFGLTPNAFSALMLKVPERNITLILLANSDGLSAPYQLHQGDVTRSVFATLFLRLVT